jgi:hypothetical protein
MSNIKEVTMSKISVDDLYLITRMRALLDELVRDGVSFGASVSLSSSYDALRNAIRRNRCQDLEDCA